MGRFRSNQWHLHHRCVRAGGGRFGLSWGRPGARHALWGQRRNPDGSHTRSPSAPTDTGLTVAHKIGIIRSIEDKIVRHHAATLPNGPSGRYKSAAGYLEEASMTYCCGILVQAGLVMVADTRTNAGLDNISTFRKLHVFEEPGHSVFALASAGNLSLAQSVVSILTEGLENAETGQVETLMNAPSMFQAAQRIGRVIRHVHQTEASALEAADVKFDIGFLFGGQIKNSPLRLFMIYAAGNFIECTIDTPYLQIGEHKYGKPILDRAVHFGIDLYDALKIALLSMDSTMRSNLGVGMPIDIMVARRDACASELNYRINPGEPYFHDLSERWSAALRAAHMAIPRPPYG